MMRNQKLQRQFKKEVLQTEALDIEDLVHLGNKLGTCPYYGSRRMLPLTDLVVLPYQSLLHNSTRESLGVNLKGSVVIIDEAHNLVDSVTSMHSCYLSAYQLRQVGLQVSCYLDKFRNKLGAGNRRYIQTLLVLIKAFLQRLAVNLEVVPSNASVCSSSSLSAVPTESFRDDITNPKMMTINDFLFSLNIDNINMFKLWKYIKESKIVHKVSSYGEKLLHQQVCSSPTCTDMLKTTSEVGSSRAAFQTLADLVLALMNADSDGRVLVVPSSTYSTDQGGQGDGYLKFVMLNAAHLFSEVIDQAHAVILAGGTLQPIEELRDRLFPELQEDYVHLFSCGHIVPKESVLPLAISHGPAGRTFDFTYQNRNSPSMMEELGRLLCNISSVVPEGIVVFFSSFEYENQVYTTWKNCGILAKLESKKHVFQEPRNATNVEQILQEYKERVMQSSVSGAEMQATGKNGALILCVVGGKMSEGINFSDGMGRCVVMVGLPYPCPSDLELMERMRYLNHLPLSSAEDMPQSIAASQKTRTDGMLGIQFLQHCSQRAREYYENLCMKAVNQSIGRAIRHIGDYAAILLVDVRYTPAAPVASRPASKLPGWIKDQLINVIGNFGEVHKRLHRFFKYNKKQIGQAGS